jgi:hypothetical protein
MRFCQVCKRELRLPDRVKGLVQPLGVRLREGGRARWVCRRCRSRAAAGRDMTPVRPANARVALQRPDLQWYAGTADDGRDRWASSRRDAFLFEDEEQAYQASVQLREKGFQTQSVMLFRRA